MGRELETETQVVETQPDFDMDAATADISSELFGQGDDEGAEVVEPEKLAEGAEDKSSGAVTADVADLPPQTAEEVKAAEEAKAVETAAEVQAVGAPKTWTKEALETWATIPSRAQTEILKREEDFLKGITQYKTAADLGVKYDAVVQPYRPVLEETGTDPVQLFQSFAANHYLLTRGTPEQKIELAASMLTGYDIPLPDLLNFMADKISEPNDPRVSALEKEIQELKSSFTQTKTADTVRANEAITAEIAAFAADPAHPHFQELASDIQKLFEAGLATNLNDAYDKAVYANPVTRQKELDRLTAERLAADKAEAEKRKDKQARSTADSVTSIPKSKNGTVPTGSIDDTLNETMAAIASRG